MKVTVSGSFNRHLADVAAAVTLLGDMRVEVLSPIDPRVVACDGSFLFVASDRVRDVELVQRGHCEAIADSDFVWVASPDGYAGCSVSMEIGYAMAAGVPVFAPHILRDRTLREFVTFASSLRAVVFQMRDRGRVTLKPQLA